ncbi:nucleotide-binding universal stress UspA family protein [Salinibacterium sp. CAN_S4]|uniref:universal stress protein n=1 Tax=Salinibacterium sp. CAN_S4 TaxID=2787727 RepID=UPI0018EF4078
MTTPSLPLVVGDDGSTGSRHALELALDLAERLDSPVIVVRSWGAHARNSYLAETLEDATPAAEFTEQVLDELVSETRSIVDEHPDVSIDFRSGSQSPADLLCEASTAARMLVVGSRGLGGVSGLLLGSVSNACLHQSTEPVLVVHEPRTPEASTRIEPRPAHPGEIAIPSVTPGSIVVGHDGSHGADRALTEALQLAHDLDVPVAIIRTWSIDSAPHGELWKDGAVASHLDVSEAVRQRLTAETQPVTSRHPGVVVDYIGVLGQPTVILTRASRDALMLVVGSRGRGGFSSLMLGSVSMHCAHRAECPVLVVPHHE